MIDAAFASHFAEEWVAAWNAHDLERILTHYADGIVFHSPRIKMIMQRDVDVVSGKAALREYWSSALKLITTLHFTLDTVMTGSDALTILYTNERGGRVAETFVLDHDHKVTTSIACYT